LSKLSERRREIQAMDVASAQDELKTLRRRLFELRLQKERGEVKNNRLFPQTKADIARLMHHLGELNSAEALEAAGELTTEAKAETTEAPKPTRAPKQAKEPTATATTDEEAQAKA
jgi:large subunit ribosomal protein L29